MDGIIIFAIISAVILVGVLLPVVYMQVVDTTSAKGVVKSTRRREAKEQRDGEKILQAERELAAEGWKP